MAKWFRQLGNSLQLPAAVLFIFGILRGLGFVLAPAALTGEEAGFAVNGIAYVTGIFLIRAGDVLIDQMPVFLAAGIGAGMSKEGDKTSCLAGLVSYLVIVGFFNGSGMLSLPFSRLSSQMIGLLSGILGVSVYHWMEGIRFPEMLSFFGGRRLAVTVAAVCSLPAAFLLLWAEPFIKDWEELAAGFVFRMEPFLLTGLPAVCLALSHGNGRKKNREFFGLFLAAFSCALFVGTPGPVVFSLLFLAPVSFLLYVLFAGILAGITFFIPVSIIFPVPDGILELILRSFAPLERAPWFLLPILFFVSLLFYGGFRLAIARFPLRLHGWEEREGEEDGAMALKRGDFAGAAKVILDGIGGKENVRQLDSCVTRLRFEVLDHTRINEKKIRSAGIAGIIRPGKHSIQAVIGMKAGIVAEEMKKIL